MSARSDMMIKLLFCSLSMKVFSCSALSSCSFRFSLSASVSCSSVALLRKSPYCSYRWHTRAITPSYRQDKKRAVQSCSPLSGSVPPLVPSPRPVPSSRRGEAFFHHLIVSSRLAVSLSHPFHLVSFPVSLKRGEGHLVSFPIPGFVPYRLVSSDEGKQDDGAVVPSCRPIPWRSFISPQSRLRLVRRLGLSCRRASRLASFRPGSSHQMRDKQARRQGVSSSSVPSHPPRPRHPCGRACRPRVLVPLSPHPQQASRRAGRTRQPRGVGGGAFLSSSGGRRGVVILPSAWRFYSHARRR